MLSEAVTYDEGNIQTLDWKEHIRRRPGMYIGKLGDGTSPDDGIYILIKEVLDNSVDEYMMGFGKMIEITLENKCVTVRDFGRGIPLGKLAEVASKMNTGAKYDSKAFKKSVGLNGVGIKAVNALSSDFVIRSIRDGNSRTVEFAAGEVINDLKESGVSEKNGTSVSFIADESIFGSYEYNSEYIETMIRNYTYLNAGLVIKFNGESFVSKNGLLDLLNETLSEEPLYAPIHLTGEDIEVAITHGTGYNESYYSFVNGQHTTQGGTHQAAFREAIVKTVREFFKKEYDANDIRTSIIAAISIKVEEPMFESQTKNKIGNTDIKGWIVGTVKQAVVDYLHRHTDDAGLLLEKVKRNEELRKEISAVQKKGREMSKRMSLRNNKLKDCKHHFGDRSKYADQTMIFLTEGDSAGGSLEQSRNPMYQAVFALRGKPLNCYGLKLDTVYTNEEFFYIVHTLDIEEDVDNLRYAKVIIATDADVDGLHIRNLLITFFLTFFEPLVLSGHLYILETPLFRVRNKKETHYCYSEEERDEMAKKLGKGAEITRFKGLGEISPKEFGQFIGDDIKLEKVTIEHSKGISEMLKFYMGDNSPERWDHIVNNLV